MPVAPQRILVMRHADKPDVETDPNLSPAGQERADKLVANIPATFGAPDFIFASAVSRHSARPFETVAPLSRTIGVPIDATIADQDYEFLASDLLSNDHYAAKRVLVCWHHGNISALAEALGSLSADVPARWLDNVFNLILKLDYGPGGPSTSQIFEPF
jgi:broad specificity phosphatase PhoE